MKRLIALAALLACGAAQASFTGLFAPGSWTQVPGTGSINVFDASGLSITSGNDLSGAPSDTDVKIALPSAGTISFDWDYTTQDASGPFFDPFFALEPPTNQLTDDGGGSVQSGFRSFSANAGDVIGFRIRTLDNVEGPATVRISNFCFRGPNDRDCVGTPAPEPGGLALLGAALVAGIASRRKPKGGAAAAV